MTEEINNTTQDDEELSFAELFEMEENNTVVNVGDVTVGTVIGTVDDFVLVDVGDKAESYIAKSEFQLDDGIEFNVGDTFEVFYWPQKLESKRGGKIWKYKKKKDALIKYIPKSGKLIFKLWKQMPTNRIVYVID